MERPSETSSAYSRLLPMVTPRAITLNFTPSGESLRDMKKLVVSPSIVGLSANITSLIPPAATLSTKLSICKFIGPTPSTVEELGGAHVHATKSGVTHFVAATEEEAAQEVRRLISFIPQNNMEETPVKPVTDDPIRLEDVLNSIVPDDPNKPYDMKDIIYSIVDDGDFMEVHKDYAKNIICGFARFNGRSTGIIANQPNWLAGVLDCDASRKAARFVRFCDAFNIQILTLVDVPGFLCGTGQEYAGIIDHGAKLMFAYGEATVPKVTVTIRKSYGGAHIVMSCKQLRGDLCYAWPNAEIAVMGASGAVGVLEAKAIRAIEDPEEQKRYIAEKEAEYNDKFASPYQAANRGYIDDVIEPRATRARVVRAFETLQTKRLANPLKKHSNIPL
jgi:acetyl-CoA carboxylase carboxyltransferase component